MGKKVLMLCGDFMEDSEAMVPPSLALPLESSLDTKGSTGVSIQGERFMIYGRGSGFNIRGGQMAPANCKRENTKRVTVWG